MPEETGVAVETKQKSDFGKIIKNIRINKLNISQAELCKRLDMSQAYLCRMEAGSVEPRYNTLLHLIEKTTKDPRDFFPPFSLYND